MNLRVLAVLCAWLAPLACSATSYFVAPDGNDANPGSSALPFLTAAKGTSVLRAGDTLTIRPGTYRETTFLLEAGSAAEPITVQAEDGVIFESPDPSGHAEAFNIGSNARHVRLIGIEATGGYGEAVLVRLGAQSIEIRDCRLHGNRVGLAIVGASGVTVRGCRLYDNVRAGLRITGASHDVTVVDTDAYNNSDGLGCSGEGDGFVSDDPQNTDLTFLRTRSYDNSEDAYDMRGSNLVFDQVESRSFCNGFKLGHNTTLSNCLVTGGRVGVETTAIASDVHYDITNCTFAGSDFPVLLGGPVAPVTSYGVRLANNIIVGPNRALDYNNAIDLVETHNIFWNGNADKTLIKVLPNSGTFTGNSVNSGAYRAATGRGSESLAMDPLFLDAEHGDYTPEPASVAIDRADAAMAADVDFYGEVRPQGNGPDIGAIETSAAVSNHAPRAHAGTLRLRRVRYGRPSLFDGGASFDPNGDALTYLWDFGDAATSTLRQPLHAYAALGDYTVTLTVSDGDQTSTDSVAVSVVGRLPPPTRTPTPAPGTPTATPSGPITTAALKTILPASVRRGALKTISVRYRYLGYPSALTIDLPNELDVVSAAPIGWIQTGHRLLWPATSFPSGTYKVKVLARPDATAGSFVQTTATLTESTGAEAIYSGLTRID